MVTMADTLCGPAGAGLNTTLPFVGPLLVCVRSLRLQVVVSFSHSLTASSQ